MREVDNRLAVSVEVATKVCLQFWCAKGRPGRRRLRTVRGGYRGDTLGAMALCDRVGAMHRLTLLGVTDVCVVGAIGVIQLADRSTSPPRGARRSVRACGCGPSAISSMRCRPVSR